MCETCSMNARVGKDATKLRSREEFCEGNVKLHINP